jgi:hypothetical protein
MADTGQHDASAEEELSKCANLVVGIIDVNTVLSHFSLTEFYDRECNNEQYKMQAATVHVPFPSATIHCMCFGQSGFPTVQKCSCDRLTVIVFNSPL